MCNIFGNTKRNLQIYKKKSHRLLWAEILQELESKRKKKGIETMVYQSDCLENQNQKKH